MVLVSVVVVRMSTTRSFLSVGSTGFPSISGSIGSWNAVETLPFLSSFRTYGPLRLLPMCLWATGAQGQGVPHTQLAKHRGLRFEHIGEEAFRQALLGRSPSWGFDHLQGGPLWCEHRTAQRVQAQP